MMVCGKKIVVERAGRVGELSLTGYSQKQCWHYIEPATLSHALHSRLYLSASRQSRDSEQTDVGDVRSSSPPRYRGPFRAAADEATSRSRAAAWPAPRAKALLSRLSPESYIEPLYNSAHCW